MTDLTGKGSGSDTTHKCCVDCQSSKTPLWRGGPAGPKSLCNACGIRYRKNRRALLGLKKEESDQKEEKKSNNHQKIQIQINNKKNNNHKISASLKIRLLAFGREVMLQRSASMGSSTTQRQQLGEEEQAAVLLMALSCGSVYA